MHYDPANLSNLCSIASIVISEGTIAMQEAKDLENYDPHARLVRSLVEVRQAVAEILAKEGGDSSLGQQQADPSTPKRDLHGLSPDHNRAQLDGAAS